MKIKQHPEKTIGPYLRGIGIAIWLNPKGRSVTINPPRYLDADGEWKDSKSYFPSDLRILAKAIADALTYIEQHPLSQENSEGRSESHSESIGTSQIGETCTEGIGKTRTEGIGEIPF